MPPEKTVLVTGATGFVGQAAVRRLLKSGYAVRMLSRRQAACPLSALLSVVRGDLHEPKTYVGALSGCLAVIHLAKTDLPESSARAAADIAVSRDLLSASIAAGVPRFVYMSSSVVYGIANTPSIDESALYPATSDSYTASKIAIEQLLLDQRSSIRSTILQPANIYGPGTCWWAEILLNMMRRGRVMLINDGRGTANLVHVEDVAQAILLALDRNLRSGERFLLTDGCPVAWHVYFEALERKAGGRGTVDVSIKQAKEWSRRLRRNSLPRRVIRSLRRRLLSEPIVYPLDDEAIERFASLTALRIDKAVRELGYIPAFNLAKGLTTF